MARQRRKGLRSNWKAQPLESLEQRVLLAAAVSFDSSTNELTVDNSAAGANSTVTIKAGSTYTDILVNNKFQTRLTEANTNNIDSILFSGDAGFVATLSVIGVNGSGGAVDITLADTDRLLLNTKNTTVTADGPLSLGKSTVAGTLDIDMSTATAGDDLTQFGKVSISGTVMIKTKDGDINFKSSGNVFGTLILDAGTGAITINESGPTTLGDSSGTTTFTGASLKVTSTGAITDVADSATPLTISGATNLWSKGNTITLDTDTSTFGALTLKGTNISVVDANATSLAGVTATGTFTLTSGGAVTKTAAAIKVNGLGTIDANGGTSDITLTSGTINFGSVSFSGATVQLSEKSAVDLDTTSATNLTVTAKGAITDSGEVIVTDDTSLTATGKTITLDESTSEFGDAAGDTLGLVGTNISVINSSATGTELVQVTAKGTFTLTSAGIVTQSAGIINATGLVTIDASENDSDITLNSANLFGSVAVFGNDVGLTEGGGTNLAASEVTGTFTLAAGAGAVIDSGDLLITGTTTITSTGAVTLDSAGSVFDGAIDLAGSNVAMTNNEATEIADVDATTFTLTSADAVTQTGPIAVTGLVTVTTPADITLGLANTIGSIAVSGDAITINDTAGGLDIVSATAATTLSVTTAGGALTDSGTISVTDTTTLQAGVSGTSFAVTLDSTTSTFGGTVTVTVGANTSIRDNDSLGLTLGASDIEGTLSLTAGGDITATAASNVDGATVTLNAGSTGSITSTGIDYTGAAIALTLTGVNATVTPTAVGAPTVALGATSLSGTLSLTNVGSVTQSAKQTVAGTTTITTETPASDDIDLSTIPGNTFGTLILTANDISIRESGATDFGTTTATGNLVVVSSGDVTDSGVVTVGGTTSVSSNGNDITLDSANVLTGALTLSGNDITVNDTTATELTSVTASGGFTLTSGGAVTDTGTVSVTGAASVSNSGAAVITLDSATNNFGSISTNGTAVSITEASATNLGATTATTLTVNSDGAITDSGTITASSTVTMTAGAGASNLDAITLDDASNTFGDLDLEGGNITIVENAATQFDDVDAAGNLSVTSAGAITQDTGELVIGGLATLVAFNGTSNQAITLNTITNNFSSVSLTGAAVTIQDADDIDLSTSSITGAFALTADGEVSDSGVLTVAGATTITTTTGSITLDEAGSSFTSIDLNADENITFVAYSGLTISNVDATAGDVVVIASGAIVEVGGGGTVNAGANIFIQAGLDPDDPTRELDPNDPADFALLNSLDLATTDPTFGGTETYVGSIVNVA